MNEAQRQEFEQLKREVSELKQYVEDRKRQQITLPLDNSSVAVINEHFMRITSAATYVNASGRLFTDYIGNQAGQKFKVPLNELYPYTANATTDRLAVEGHAFATGARVYLYTSDTEPGGLSASTVSYYVVNPSGTSIQLSATSGGSAINITSAGTGNQFIGYY